MALKILIFLYILPLVISTSKNIKVINFYEDAVVKYEPTWESLDKRPLPAWYDDVKFGIFLHWGVYSVPSFGSEWFWSNWEGLDPKILAFMMKNYPIGFTYQQFASDFKAEFFNATQWADLFYESGAKYIVLTSKHHEGFTLWPSSRAFSWNAKDVGPHKDLVKELSEAVRRKQGMHFGVYYSLYEWYNPMYLQDKQNMFKSQDYVKDKMLPELHELINNYHPEVLWTDGDWEAKDVYWEATDFLAWLYNESPVKDTVVANDRWGSDIPCHHGGFYTCTDRYNPGKLQEHKWENCMTVDKKSWGFRRNAELSEYMTLHELITQLVSTVSCGGNLLMNVGPTKEGTIAPIFQERLKGMGEWLKINGDAIYKTKPWDHQNDTINSDVWYTAPKIQTKISDKRIQSVKNTVYAVTLKWPENNLLIIGALTGKIKPATAEIFLLNDPQIKLKWTEKDQKVEINFPDLSIIKSKEAWTLKITYK